MPLLLAMLILLAGFGAGLVIWAAFGLPAAAVMATSIVVALVRLVAVQPPESPSARLRRERMAAFRRD
jgi:hypothetical protein